MATGQDTMRRKMRKNRQKREKQKKEALYMSKFSDKYHKEMEERRKKDEAKRNNKKNTTILKKENKKKSSYTPLEDDNDAADRQEEKVFRSSSSGKIAKEKHAKIAKDKANKAGAKKAKNATTTGGPVKSGVEYARSKGDDLAGFRKGPGTGRKDTRITKHLKKSGFTEDRLARLRKEHAEWKAARKNKKKLKKNTGG
tara:strand:+ start:74 stop:667 length:594 start_codon:yes stop_codon:yes gene_type:complete